MVFTGIWTVAVLLQSKFFVEKVLLPENVLALFLHPRQKIAHPVDGLSLFIVQHMGVLLGGDNGGMTHQVLDVADGDILFHQPGGKGVPLRYNKDKSETPLLPRLLKC